MHRLISVVAMLLLAAAPLTAQRSTFLWKVDGGSNPRFPAANDSYRGAAYNPATGHYLVASRAVGNKVYVIDAATGAILDSLRDRSPSVISGGDVVLADVEVTADGVIYASNVSVAGTNFRIYRWASETDTVKMVWQGNAGGWRIGDVLDVAGTGTGTVIYASGNGTTSRIAKFTPLTTDTLVIGTQLDITPPNDAGAGIAQITPGGNAYISRFQSNNRIDLISGTGAKLDDIPTARVGPANGDLHYTELVYGADTLRLLGVAIMGASGQDSAAIAEVSGTGTDAVILDRLRDLGAVANANASSDIHIKLNVGAPPTVYVLLGNNGFAAFQMKAVTIPIVQRSSLVPLAGQPMTITAGVGDLSGVGVTSVTLTYKVDGGSEVQVPMTRIDGSNVKGEWSADIPGSAHTNGARIEYAVSATNGADSYTTPYGAANAYFAGLTPLSLTGFRAVDANGVNLYRGYYATVTGTINSPDYQTTNMGYNFQDAVGGINLFQFSSNFPPPGTKPVLKLGDSVLVTGKLDQFRGLAEIVPDNIYTNIQVIDSGKTIVPIVVTLADFNANPELYEGRVITMKNLNRRDTLVAWPDSGSSANIVMVQGAGADTIVMRIDSDTPVPGIDEPAWPVDVTGVGGQFTTSTTVNNDGYQIAPRYPTDFFTEIHDIGVASLEGDSYWQQSRPESTPNDRGGRGGNVAVQPTGTIRLVGNATFALTDTVKLYAVVENFGTMTETAYDVDWAVGGTALSNVAITQALAPGARDTVELVWIADAAGTYSARAWTILATDANAANDTSNAFAFQVLPANVSLMESFGGSFPPPGWTVVDADTDAAGNGWFRSTSNSFTNILDANGYAADDYESANINKLADDYLITPDISRPAQPLTVDSLSFWAVSRFTEPGYPDSLMVMVSTTGTDTADFDVILDYFKAPTAGWTRFAYALPAGAKHVAFRYLLYDAGATGNSGDKIGVDQVMVMRHFAPVAGWSTQTSGTTEQLLAVAAVSPTVAWASGVSGTVLRTVNGGATWTSVGGAGIGGADVNCLEAVDANTAFVSTAPSATIIYRTTDGGATWASVFSQAGGFLDGIHMYDATNGIAVGDPVGGKWTILRTTDGGATWARIATEPAQFSNEWGATNGLETWGTTHIWFTPGNPGNGARIYRSTDGGATWDFSSLPFDAFTPALYFANDKIGFVGATANRATSLDGGATWNTFSPGGTGRAWGISGSGKDVFITRGPAVYRSTNYGDTWELSTPGAGQDLRAMDFVPGPAVTSGWAVGDNGTIIAFFGTVTDVPGGQDGLPTEFALLQNYPNPFNPSTTIRYMLPEAAKVTVRVYSILGQEVAVLSDEVRPAGEHSIVWNARSSSGMQVATGLYLYRIEAQPVAGGSVFTDIKKMMLLK